MTNNIRRQLTLFVEQKDSEAIEKIRQQFNRRQSDLIKCHITLCREDEIDNLEQVVKNLYCLTTNKIVIEFGKATRFDDEKGVLLPAKTDNPEFQTLRRQILSGINDNPRKQKPHMTLLHPRNSTCTDNVFKQIKQMNLPTKLEFKSISLIEQKNGGQWRILQEFGLTDKASRGSRKETQAANTGVVASGTRTLLNHRH